MRPKKGDKYLIFNGEYFSLDPKTGYWQSTKTRERMHRYVWRFYYGDIPQGYHVHHIDGDKSNNDISNLTLLTPYAHAQIHKQNRSSETTAKLKANCEKIRPLTKAWHGSKEGKEWHKRHYEATKDKLYIKKDYICLNCGKAFKSSKAGAKFCCNACKSKYRRKAGLDDITKICAYCGKEFKCNKYSKQKYCCLTCANRAHKQ